MPAETGDELFEAKQKWNKEKSDKLEHKTGEYYASLAEKDRAEFHKRIENSDLPKDKKIEYIAVFDKGFDLGFACAKQYCDKDLQNLTAELTSMTKEEFDSYAKLHKLLTEMNFCILNFILYLYGRIYNRYNL